MDAGEGHSPSNETFPGTAKSKGPHPKIGASGIGLFGFLKGSEKIFSHNPSVTQAQPKLSSNQYLTKASINMAGQRSVADLR